MSFSVSLLHRRIPVSATGAAVHRSLWKAVLKRGNSDFLGIEDLAVRGRCDCRDDKSARAMRFIEVSVY
jgi:hypothetical protein